MPQLSRLTLAHEYVLSARNACRIACRPSAVSTMAELRFTRITDGVTLKIHPQEKELCHEVHVHIRPLSLGSCSHFSVLQLLSTFASVTGSQNISVIIKFNENCVKSETPAAPGLNTQSSRFTMSLFFYAYSERLIVCGG